MNLKAKKGEKGYIARKTKNEIIKTILMFLIPLALFIAGYITTKTRLNVLTIVAVLGMLPASKNAVSMIMYIKSHGITGEDYESIHPFIKEDMITSYDNVFTTYEKTYEVPSLVVRGGNVCGYVAKEYPKLPNLDKHLADCIKKEGYPVNVKIFDKKEAYITRLQSIAGLEDTPEHHSQEIREILFDISL